MIRVKVNGKSYKTFCGCDKDWKSSKILCYGDEMCQQCGYFPWAATEKSAAILSTTLVRRNIFNLNKK